MKKRQSSHIMQVVLIGVLLFLSLTMIIPVLNIFAKSISDPKQSPLMKVL